ncbi:MAG TPA: hypothetical protein EYG86_01240 [Crocinitomicaceae bacterium]|nr:hypothetical protein [Crocinitomicaceae bacterium]
MEQVTIDIPDGKFEFFMELFQKLGLKATSNLNYPSMTRQQIIDQALIAEKEIKQGKTTSHDQVLKDFKKW